MLPPALLAGSFIHPDPVPLSYPADNEADQDFGDLPAGTDEDALNDDDLDTDAVTSTP